MNYSSKHQNCLDKHNTHEVDVILTPEINHYAKLVCSQCNNLFLQWLSRTDAETILGVLPKKAQAAKHTNWSNTQHKERQHYKSYQRDPLSLPRTPTQLINDRLALTGHSRFNGNSIYTVPISYLQTLLDTNKINRKEDRQLIQAAIEKRQQIGA